MIPTVCLVFTDIEGSTALWDRSPEAMADALGRHDAILAEHIGGAGGRVVKHTGDGVFAVFDDVPSAVAAVIGFQRELASEIWPAPIDSLKVRVGVHAGSPSEKDGDYFGPDLSRAARLETAGHGGQILLSEAARLLAHRHLEPGVELAPLGEYRFKGLIRPESVHQLNVPGLASSFPPLRTERVGAGVGLPPVSSGIVGRDVLADKIEQLIAEGRRLLTLTGPGGVGKSRLSLEVAGRLAGHFEHGAHFVALAAASSRDDAVQAIVEALGFNIDTHSSDEPPLEQVLGYLSHRSVLLVLDNYEQLVEGAAEIPGEIVARSPGSAVLVTTRESLRTSAESLVEVPGLAVGGRDSPAVALFLERSERAGVSVDQLDLTEVAGICEFVGGMPLGIELAASWTGLLSPGQIRAELEESLSGLEAAIRDVPDRHRTLAAACASSWRLLNEEEQRVFAGLGVFRGRFGKSSAEAVTGCDLRTLASLSAKSLIHGWGLFALHPVLRRFARDRLSELGMEDLAATHARHYVALVQKAVPDLEGGRQIDAREEIRQELADVLAAYRWVVEHGSESEVLEALPSLQAFMRLQGWHEGKAEFERLRGLLGEDASERLRAVLDVYWASFAVELDDPTIGTAIALDRLPAVEGLPLERAIALTTAGIGLSLAGRYEESASLLDDGVTAARAVGADVGMGAGLLWLGWDWLELGHPGRAQPLFEEALGVFRSSGNAWGSAYALSKMGLVADSAGDHKRAIEYHREGREVFVKLGDRAGEAYTLSRLSWTEWLLGNFESAEQSATEALELFDEIGHLWGGIASRGRRGFARVGLGDLAGADEDFRCVLERAVPAGIATMVIYGVIGFGCVLVASGGDDARAAEILSCALADEGCPRQYRTDYGEPALDSLASRMPPDEFAAARMRGEALDLGDLVESLVPPSA